MRWSARPCFSLVTLALASSQYTSRILRNFMRDRVTQVVLGIFAGIFTYCLIVLRTIRGGDDAGFVASVAVSFGVVLAIGIAMMSFGVGLAFFFGKPYIQPTAPRLPVFLRPRYSAGTLKSFPVKGQRATLPGAFPRTSTT